MPELPEVEVVRRGLDRHVSGRTIAAVEVRHPRAVRRHEAGPADFAARLPGLAVVGARRRGKYLWLPLAADAREARAGGSLALLGHLGMSGQLLVQPGDAPDEVHLRVRIAFRDGGPELRFVDQRTFGGLALAELAPGADPVPVPIVHIARDPLDPGFDEPATVRRLRARRSEVKRVLLDQTVLSGVGNIYADEALWRARLHGGRRTDALPAARVRELLGHVRQVMLEALDEGGTSFDALYVNVNGQSGYFDRRLNAYGREGEPCRRCGTPIRRIAFMNRSSYFCPACQRAPRRPSGAGG